MDGWKRLDETSLLKIKTFYSNKAMEKITKANYKHSRRVWEDFLLQDLVLEIYDWILLIFFQRLD